MYRVFFFIICLFLLSGCTSDKPSMSSSSGSEQTGVSYQDSLDPDERIALAKKRKSYIRGIRKGDFYSLRNAPEEALEYYLQVQEKLPSDQVVRKKTAHVYAQMKNWSRAYGEYIKVPLSELKKEERDELLYALFFDEETFDRLGELDKLSLPKEEKEYYKMIDTCYTGIHNCIVSLESYTGSVERINELKDQIQNAVKISTDYQYRNMLVAARLYEQGMYRASEKFLQEILKERPDYIEAKKMLGFSLFELGKYEEAKKYLLEYLDQNPTDLDSIVYLGELYFHLSDYVSSNLYLNNAIIAGYTPKENLERRLAYNYSLLSDTVGMMKVLNYLLQGENATEDDFIVGISLALAEGKYSRAESWARDGLMRHKDSHFITPLYIQTLRLEGQIDNASALIQNTSEEAMIENPNYLLEKAIIYYELGDRVSAKLLFEELVGLADWPDIVDESRIYLSRISITP